MVKRQSAQVNAGTVANTTLNFVNPVLANSALYCAVRNGGTSVPSSVVDTLGQTFTLDASQVQTTDSSMLSLWSVTNSNAGVDGVTVTLGAAQTLRVVILEYAGMALTGLFDVTSGNQVNTATTLNSGNISTAQNSELLLCLFGNSSGATMVADGAFTEQEVVVPGAGNGRFEVSDRIVSSTGVYSAAPSQGVAGNLAVLLVSYRGLVIVTNVFTGFGRRFIGHFTEV